MPDEDQNVTSTEYYVYNRKELEESRGELGGKRREYWQSGGSEEMSRTLDGLRGGREEDRLCGMLDGLKGGEEDRVLDAPVANGVSKALDAIDGDEMVECGLNGESHVLRRDGQSSGRAKLDLLALQQQYQKECTHEQLLGIHLFVHLFVLVGIESDTDAGAFDHIPIHSAANTRWDMHDIFGLVSVYTGPNRL